LSKFQNLDKWGIFLIICFRASLISPKKQYTGI